ncbi:DsbA family protein [Ancylobacter defluvii]|uniref:DsbA family protein n=1 Tax=Ancylobacter defluvii TaxID=1282440 RepID=A0A9W6NA98_9HYPH|nr:DsbA family protein [Ancylobacter defluvii]MBS7590416.1 DsbA family protein [Ancylobacter defluvii]GLK83337.1 DsbA family protein [Ancylobacter defluvii]
MTDRTTITYLFDPLCGWCYGAGPALDMLAADPAFSLELAPTGLFAGAGARPMDGGFAAYAWANDQRIEKLTGQRFTAAYRDKVLADRQRRFDSGPATLALTAVHLTAPEGERAALKAIQHARYVDGRDITDAAVLAALLDGAGFRAAAGRLACPDDDLLAATQARIAAARQQMHGFGVAGVPALMLGEGDQRRLLPAAALFHDLSTLLTTLTAA